MSKHGTKRLAENTRPQKRPDFREPFRHKIATNRTSIRMSRYFFNAKKLKKIGKTWFLAKKPKNGPKVQKRPKMTLFPIAPPRKTPKKPFFNRLTVYLVRAPQNSPKRPKKAQNSPFDPKKGQNRPF